MKLLSSVLLFISLSTASAQALANGQWPTLFANNTSYAMVLTKVAGADTGGYCYSGGKGVACSPVVNAGDTQHFMLSQQNSDIQFDYDMCQSVDNNNQCQGFVHHLSFTLSHAAPKVANPGNFEVSYDTTKQEFTVTGSGVTPVLPKPMQYSSVPYRGVNLSGAEFGAKLCPSCVPTANDASYFVKQGMNTFRIPIKWSYAQNQLGGPLNTAYISQVHSLVQQLLAAHYNVVLDLHAYMRFSPKQGAGQGTLVNAANMADIWSKLGKAFTDLAKDYPQQLIFGLMNEPNTMPTADALQFQLAGSKALRSLGLTNLVLIEGNSWSGLHSWGQVNAGVYTPASIDDPNYAIDVHQYFDTGFSGSSSTCIPLSAFNTLNMPAFIAWMQQNHMKVFVSEFGAGNTTNCQQDLNKFLQLVQAHAYSTKTKSGFVGWTAWSAGHSWGTSYPLSLTPGGAANGLMTGVFNNFLSTAKH